jgi:ABC-2 type transport system permease protein
MPVGLQWFAQCQPFTPFIETLRGLLLGTPLGWSPVLAIGWCVVIAVAGYAWSMAIYERKSLR